MENDRIWTLLTRKLSGAATDTELTELDELIAANPNTEKMLSAVADHWASTAPTDPEFLEATYIQHVERMKSRGHSLTDESSFAERFPLSVHAPRRTSKRVLKPIALTAALLTIFAATWVVLKKPGKTTSATAKKEIALVSTTMGSRTKLILPDGSSVWLNAGSTLKYNKQFDNGVREVELIGEAFFDVKKHDGRAFIIHTKAIDVKVMGTQFNVKAYQGDKTTETSLIEGSVEVSLLGGAKRKYLLKPRQKLVLTQPSQEPSAGTTSIDYKPGTVALSTVEIKQLTYLAGNSADVESSWTRNILSFEDEPFADVAKKMERWFDVRFEFKNKQLKEQFLTGSFEKESLEQALTALQFSTGFKFTIKNKIILIY